MSLLWKRAVGNGSGDFEAHMTPQELLAHPAAGMLPRATKSKGIARNLAVGPGAARVAPLADSIKQHGYQPEMHGHLHLEQRSDGFSQYHASGHEAEGHPLAGLQSGSAGKALVMALHDSGHSGAVPVHSFHTNAPNSPAVQRAPEPEPEDEGPALYHGTIHELEGQIHPNHTNNGNFGAATHEPGHAYATPNVKDAWEYATRAADHHGKLPRVYQVHPTGPVEKDPQYDSNGTHRGNYQDDLRSKHPFDVGEEQEPPAHIREHYHDDPDFEGSEYHHSRGGF